MPQVLDVHCTRPGGAHKGNLPYAAPPHDLVADPRLKSTDVRIAACLLYWARSKAVCWPADATIGRRAGCSVGTVQRSLRRLQAAGWIARERTSANRTGRLIVLTWRTVGARPVPPPAPEPPRPMARDEGTVIVKGDERKGDGATIAERRRPAPTSAEARPGADLHREWLASDDPILRAEAARRLAPRSSEPAPPTSTADLLARISESPAHVAAAAELLARDLDDRKSWSGFHAACRRAWEGSIDPRAVVTAWEEASSGRARNPGALFMSVLKRESRR